MKNVELFECVKEFLNLANGERISDPYRTIIISPTAKFTRKSLKHFIESRRRADNSRKQIYYLLEKVAEVSSRPQIDIKNHNKAYPKSRLLGRFYQGVDKAIIIVLDQGKNPRDVVSLHFKSRKSYERMSVNKK